MDTSAAPSKELVQEDNQDDVEQVPVVDIPISGPSARSAKSPPRQPRNFRPTPSRSPSPPPIPSEPSSEYLETASQTPSHLETSDDVESHRKLLILDLNGTLLVRTSRGTPHPRPFMPMLRDYLFHEDTRKWLDVMIWSSAQPHNVNKMVRKCFFPSKPEQYSYGDDHDLARVWEGKFVAVWARDTLGLSSRAYARKTQTTKDLAKPWSQISDRTHSALSTLLLDDSPLKARLQPYNHLCVSEYNGKTREVDLTSKSKLMGERQDELESQNSRDASPEDSVASEPAGDDLTPSPGIANDEATGAQTSPEKTNRERKRKEKKERKKREKAAAKSAIHHLTEDDSPQGVFDETLLAIIGILDEIKFQKNVAAWIKHDGLWADKVPQPSDGESGVDLGANGRPGSPTDAEVDDDGPHELPPESSQPTITSFSPPSSPSSNSKTEHFSNNFKRGRSENSSDRSEPAKKGRAEAEEEPSSNAVLSTHTLWFEHPEVFKHWIDRGRRALSALGIREDDGIEVDPSFFGEIYKH